MFPLDLCIFPIEALYIYMFLMFYFGFDSDFDWRQMEEVEMTLLI